MSAAHTPAPWRVDPHYAADVQSADGALEIATTHPVILCGGESPDLEECHANARFIVHAVNCHDDLLAALTLARTFMVDFEGLPETEADNPLRVVDAALAKTREIGK